MDNHGGPEPNVNAVVPLDFLENFANTPFVMKPRAESGPQQFSTKKLASVCVQMVTWDLFVN